MLSNLSDTSRKEILAQKLAAAVASNSEVDARDTSAIVDAFVQRSLEDILALLSDPGLLASEWDIEQQANAHLQCNQPSVNVPAAQDPLPPAQPADASCSNSSTAAPKESGGISVQDYNTETEEYIEMLMSQPESERRKKLGSKLFPLIKGMGYKDSTRLTVWILAHMSQDVRTLAYTLNDTAKLGQIVSEAQAAIGSDARAA
ncbi:hypothetical protein H4R21_004428 [Coemansia helicoidea]|uniref:Uncharacterized protein n=2 Tax=Coemansia TaxID=4863 RepID=A0ACC1KXZ3_9FUNG|nr:hypothetical protein H4R21_004428 [Coemansia helicoidea]